MCVHSVLAAWAVVATCVAYAVTADRRKRLLGWRHVFEAGAPDWYTEQITMLQAQYETHYETCINQTEVAAARIVQLESTRPFGCRDTEKLQLIVVTMLLTALFANLAFAHNGMRKERVVEAKVVV